MGVVVLGGGALWQEAVGWRAEGLHDSRGRYLPTLSLFLAQGVVAYKLKFRHCLCAVCVSPGAADGSLKVWDRRKLPANGAAAVASTAAVHSFTFHKDAIMRVEWHASAPVRGRGRGGGRGKPGKV